VLQWKRRCLENYLIDLEVLSRLLMDDEIAQTPMRNEGEVRSLLSRLALSQLRDVSVRTTYAKTEFIGLGIRKDDLVAASTADIATVLLARIETARTQIAGIDSALWAKDFVSKVDAEHLNLEKLWESNWPTLCDGKRLLQDLSKQVKFRMNQKKFKIRLMKEMALARSPNWLEVESELKSLLA
jgi:hypothetical protein